MPGYAILARMGPSNRLNVLISADLPADAVDGLRSLDARLHITQLSPDERVFYASRKTVGQEPRDEPRRSIARQLADAEVLITFPQTPDDLSSSVPRLRWLQLLTAGADELPDLELLQRVPVTTMRGVRDRPVAEYALLFMLALAKRLPQSLQLMKQRQWSRVPAFELQGRTVLVIGLGSIGTDVAASRPKPWHAGAGNAPHSDCSRKRHCRSSASPEQLRELLTQSDFVILTAPLTAETAGMIGEPELRAMQANAYLINLARGQLVDEEALVRALREGWIAGAGLDVTDSRAATRIEPAL